MTIKSLSKKLAIIKMDVLIVDDDPAVCATIKAMLSQLGNNNATIVESAEDALEHLLNTENKTNLIISDWNMPGLTGLEFLRLVRHDKGATMPFLMITARNDTNSVKEAKKYGVTSYIIKPFNMTELHEKIEDCCV